MSGVEDVQVGSIPEQRKINGQEFPLVITPPDSAKDIDEWCRWAQSNTDAVKSNLLKYGAILFRGFPIRNPEDFDSFVKSFGIGAFPYVGGAAPRNVVTGNVFTANEAPPSELIPFHHEMAQVPKFPGVLFFYCETAPPVGGETPLVYSNEAYELMQARLPDFVDRLEKEGVRYTRVLPNGDDPTSAIGRGWQSTYLTDDRQIAEDKARQQGTDIEWLADGCLKTSTKVLSAIRVDERTGKKTWFNSIIAAYLGWSDKRNDRKSAVRFPNGDVMPEDAMATLEQTLNEVAVNAPWRKGDVMMVDNRQALHARRSYTPPRRIMACLCGDM